MRPPVDGPMFVMLNVVLAVVVFAGFAVAVWYAASVFERRFRRR